MDLELAKKLIIFLRTINTPKIVLIGGEPTIYQYFIDVIKFIREAQILPVLITNGRQFADREFAKKTIYAGMSNITISIKAANPQHYIQLTGSDGYGEMIRGFENLQSLGLHAPFSLTISSDLIDYLPEMLKTIIEIGVKRVSINMAYPIVMKRGVCGEGIQDPKKDADVITYVDQFLADKNISYDFQVATPWCLFSADVKNELRKKRNVFTCCHIQKGTGLVFDPAGRVLPCNHFVDHPMGQFGKDFKDAVGFNEFWRSRDVLAFRKICQRYPSDKCKICDDWDNCGGGCFIKWLHFKPGEFIE